jgi:hypothetical protein
MDVFVVKSGEWPVGRSDKEMATPLLIREGKMGSPYSNTNIYKVYHVFLKKKRLTDCSSFDVFN